jgi:hypothetical protein
MLWKSRSLILALTWRWILNEGSFTDHDPGADPLFNNNISQLRRVVVGQAQFTELLPEAGGRRRIAAAAAPAQVLFHVAKGIDKLFALKLGHGVHLTVADAVAEHNNSLGPVMVGIVIPDRHWKDHLKNDFRSGSLSQN